MTTTSFLKAASTDPGPRWPLNLWHIVVLVLWIMHISAWNVQAAAFIPSGSLQTARHGHTATLLNDGRILIAGGEKDFALAGAEVFNPATGIVTETGRLVTARRGHSATVLNNGKVLVAGGEAEGQYHRSAEIYDPATGTFTATGDMTESRSGHTATALPDGKVLIAGGYSYTTRLSGAEIYNPALGTFTAIGKMTASRTGHTATLLANGDILITGGGERIAELFFPGSGTFTATGRMMLPRSGHSATLLSDGRVLCAGGSDYTTAEVYDPSTFSFTTAGDMTRARTFHTATLLDDGKVLVAGGEEEWVPLATTELYDPLYMSFTETAPMAVARSEFAAVHLPDGKVFIVGGINYNGHVSGSELYVSDETDATAPETTILEAPRNPTNETDATFIFSASESGVIFECRLDDSEFGNCSNPFTLAKLTAGTHLMSARARDAAGNVDPTPAVYSWTIDTTAPATTASPPGGHYEYVAIPKTVTLATSEAATIYYTTDGSEPTTSSHLYSQPINLTDSMILKFFAVDTAGNLEPVKTEVYTIDDPTERSPVVVIISMLPDGAVTNDPVCNISGTVSDPAAIKAITINGTVMTITPDGAFRHALLLKEGPNTITIVVDTVAENGFTETRTITYKPTSPFLSVSEPPDNATTNRAVIAVRGTADPNASVSIAVNGGQPEDVPLASGAFSSQATLAAGLNTIVVTATDASGATTTVKRSITYDSRYPELAVTDPDHDIATNRSSILLKGRASSPLTPVTVTVAVDGQTFTPSVVDGVFQQPIQFTDEKTYAIMVSAADEAGNTAWTQRNIIYSKAVNRDGLPKLTLVDAMKAYLISLGLSEATEAEKARYDVAPLGADDAPLGNGRIEVGDVTAIMWNVLGLLDW